MLQEILNFLPFAVLCVNRGLLVTYANPAAEHMLEGSCATLQKTPLHEIIHHSCDLTPLIQKTFLEGGQIKRYDFQLMNPRIGSKQVLLYLTPFTSNEVLLCMDDSTTAHTLEHSSALSEQALFQSSMAAILAHEVKNPLAGIKGAAQLLQKTATLKDRELTLLISNEVDRIKNLVEEIEFFSNPSDIIMEAVNIHEVLHYAKSVIERSTSQTIHFHEVFDPSLPPVLGNRNLLIQLFINLFQNAIEASDEEKLITISSSYKTGLKMIIDNGGKTSKPLPIHVRVHDNGKGIADTIRKRIFDPFVTTKKTGKGLGLAIAAKIIADHDGIIELDNKEESGTGFNIYLPVFN